MIDMNRVGKRNTQQGELQTEVARRRSFGAGWVALGLALVLSTASVASAAGGPVPGSDDNPAILRETNLEASNPSGPDRLPKLKNEAAQAIAMRQGRLAALAKSLSNGNAKKVDCAQAVVIPLLIAESKTLSELGQRLAAETDIKKARDSYRRIFTDSRVFLLHNSRAHLVEACITLELRALKLTSRLAEATTLDPTESARLGAVVAQVANDSRVAITPLLTLVPDRGDKAVLAVNVTALNSAADALRVMQTSLNDVDSAIDGVTKKGKRTESGQSTSSGKSGKEQTTTLPG
jgi:hypothetical protein